jgi:hypothetical protein
VSTGAELASRIESAKITEEIAMRAEAEATKLKQETERLQTRIREGTGTEGWGLETKQATNTNRLGERELEESDEFLIHPGPATRRGAKRGIGHRSGRKARVSKAEERSFAEVATPQREEPLNTRVRNRADVTHGGAAEGGGYPDRTTLRERASREFDGPRELSTVKTSNEPMEESVQEGPKRDQGGGAKTAGTAVGPTSNVAAGFNPDRGSGAQGETAAGESCTAGESQKGSDVPGGTVASAVNTGSRARVEGSNGSISREDAKDGMNDMGRQEERTAHLKIRSGRIGVQ